ncbi:MAG: sialate O-acetylesterase [Terracidiphilus sp.]
MNILMKRMAGLVCAVLMLATAASAEVRLPNVFSDHGVLQRGQPVRIWGWAAPGEEVTVQFHGQERKAAADSVGAWQVWLMPEKAGGPYVLSVSGNETPKPIERRDILVGDVWVASGQSNMEFPLNGFSTATLKNGAQEIANANHPRIRLLHVSRAVSSYPLSDVDGTWTACTPETAATFSAVAYFFGREISARLNVPVGLIESDWGGTPAQSWVSFGALGSADFSTAFRDGEAVTQEQSFVHQAEANFAAQNAVLKTEGKPALKYPHRLNEFDGSDAPAVLFNGMIAPLTSYTIKGVIWYQGESDTIPQRAANYARLFPLLITDWRNRWDEGNFPFLFVQISSFAVPGGGWAEVRDAQRRTLALRNTQMVVTLDVGDPHNVHPPDKQTVGARLALAALGGVYGKKLAFASPEFLEATTEGNSIRVWFTHAEGLNSHGQPLGGFEVAGKDDKFVPADTKIEKIGGVATVVVSAPGIAEPLYVRYGWSSVVTHYLYNNADLPLGTFTAAVSR